MTTTKPDDLCQLCGTRPRQPKERYCLGCGVKVKNIARRKSREECPTPFMGYSDARGRPARAPDHSPIYDDDE